MALVPLGEQEITIEKDGTNQTTKTVTDGDTIEILNYINNHGSATINGPNDVLSGQGYYTSITNNITNQGTPNINDPSDIPSSSGYYSGFNNNIRNHGSATISGPNDTLSGTGYYTGISNSITDQGSLSNVTPGNNEPSGYYTSGEIPGSNPSLVQKSTNYTYGGGGISVSTSATLSNRGIVTAAGGGANHSSLNVSFNSGNSISGFSSADEQSGYGSVVEKLYLVESGTIDVTVSSGTDTEEVTVSIYELT